MRNARLRSTCALSFFLPKRTGFLKAKRFKAVLACLILSSVAFGLEAGARPLDQLGASELAKRISELGYLPTPAQTPGRGPDHDAGDCEQTKSVLNIVDPMTKETRAVDLYTYRPDVKERVPVVVVVPTIEGVTVIEPKVASQLCGAGIAAVIADVVDTSLPTEMPGAGLEDLQGRRAIIAIRSTLDSLSRNPHYDADRMGLIGLSVGAIMSSMVAGLEPVRLKAVVLTLAGGNLPFVMSTSDQRKIVALREQRSEYLKLNSIDEYETWMRANMKYDPIYFAPNAARDRIMMITARGDTKVPYTQQKELFEAFHQPLVSEYSGGHLETILSLTYWYFGDVTKFFQAKFNMTDSFIPLVPTFH